jgi:hypothetical protein
MKYLILIGLLVLTPACAGNLTPVAAVASNATKVELTAGQLLAAAQTAHTQLLNGKPLISTAQLDQVALVCDKLGRLGTTLSKTLTDYQAAKVAGTSTTALAATIQTLVGDATAALQTIGQSIPQGTVATIDSIVTAALGLWAQIAAANL